MSDQKSSKHEGEPESEPETPDTIAADDPHKTEKLTKIGHEGDPDEGSE